MRFAVAFLLATSSCVAVDVSDGSTSGAFAPGDELGTILVELPPLNDDAPSGPAWMCVSCSGAEQGDVIDITGLDVPAAPDPGFLAAVLSARVLVFSDSPESPSRSGALVRADVPAGDVRLFAWHANGFKGGAPLD